MNQVTLALHSEAMSVVASGETFSDMRLFSVEPDEQSEFDLAPSAYARYAAVGLAIPAFMALLDAFAARIEHGGGDAPTFAEGLATQRVLAQLGYGR
jgi:hypothetical protein